MSLYLRESQVPELGPLPESLRRVVARRALVLMRSEARLLSLLPTLLCVVGGVAGWFIGGVLLVLAAQLGYAHETRTLTGDSLILSFVGSTCGTAAVGFSAGFIGLLVQRSNWRPYLRRAIAEYVSKPTQST
jgi:hypothetical protein